MILPRLFHAQKVLFGISRSFYECHAPFPETFGSRRLRLPSAPLPPEPKQRCDEHERAAGENQRTLGSECHLLHGEEIGVADRRRDVGVHGVKGVVSVRIIEVLSGGYLLFLEFLVVALVALADLQLRLEASREFLRFGVAEVEGDLARLAMVNEPRANRFLGGKSFRLENGALVRRPRQTSLVAVHHGLAERQGEVWIGAAAETPHADDAEARLIEGDRLPAGQYALTETDVKNVSAQFRSILNIALILEECSNPADSLLSRCIGSDAKRTCSWNPLNADC